MPKEAVKKDQGKPQIHLVPPQAILGIARVMTYGIGKYSEYNYRNGKGLNWMRVYDALQRHLLAWVSGETFDKETGENHLFHAGCCLVMLIDLQTRGFDDGDDRPINPPVTPQFL